MRRDERFEDAYKAVQDAITGRLVETWTAMPGIIHAYNAAAMTVQVQPAVQAQILQPDQTWISISLPLLLDCPVVFPSGGGITLTFPIAVGDECLVVFGSRCIDAWWQNGGVQPQAEIRMHDLSDGFALVGVRSQPRVVPNVSTTTAQLRTDSGSVVLTLDPTGSITLHAPTSITLDAPVTYITGILQANTAGTGLGVSTLNGSLHTTGDVVAAGISVDTHHHTGVTTGGSNTGGPV